LLDHGAVKRAGRGRPRLRPDRIVGDKGYSSRMARQTARRRGIAPVIPTKSNEPRQRHFDRELYRERNQVERCINRLKQYRRVATRYEKLAVNYLAMVSIAAILIWL
jgi:transposase